MPVRNGHKTGKLALIVVIVFLLLAGKLPVWSLSSYELLLLAKALNGLKILVLSYGDLIVHVHLALST